MTLPIKSFHQTFSSASPLSLALTATKRADRILPQSLSSIIMKCQTWAPCSMSSRTRRKTESTSHSELVTSTHWETCPDICFPVMSLNGTVARSSQTCTVRSKNALTSNFLTEEVSSKSSSTRTTPLNFTLSSSQRTDRHLMLFRRSSIKIKPGRACLQGTKSTSIKTPSRAIFGTRTKSSVTLVSWAKMILTRPTPSRFCVRDGLRIPRSSMVIS